MIYHLQLENIRIYFIVIVAAAVVAMGLNCALLTLGILHYPWLEKTAEILRFKMYCTHDTKQLKPDSANRMLWWKRECWIFWDKQVAEKQAAAIQTNGNFSIEIAQILPISSAAVLLKFS